MASSESADLNMLIEKVNTHIWGLNPFQVVDDLQTIALVPVHRKSRLVYGSHYIIIIIVARAHASLTCDPTSAIK